MGVMRRAIIFFGLEITSGVLFIFHSRVLLPLLARGNSIAGTGPATDALNLLPTATVVAIGVLQVAAIGYLLTGIGEERVSQRVQRGPPR